MPLDCLLHTLPGKEQSQTQMMSIVVGHLPALEMRPYIPPQVAHITLLPFLRF